MVGQFLFTRPETPSFHSYVFRRKTGYVSAMSGVGQAEKGERRRWDKKNVKGKRKTAPPASPHLGTTREHQRAEFSWGGGALSSPVRFPSQRSLQPSPCQTCRLTVSNVRGETAAERTLHVRTNSWRQTSMELECQKK